MTCKRSVPTVPTVQIPFRVCPYFFYLVNRPFGEDMAKNMVSHSSTSILTNDEKHSDMLSELPTLDKGQSVQIIHEVVLNRDE